MSDPQSGLYTISPCVDYGIPIGANSAYDSPSILPVVVGGSSNLWNVDPTSSTAYTLSLDHRSAHGDQGGNVVVDENGGVPFGISRSSGDCYVIFDSDTKYWTADSNNGGAPVYLSGPNEEYKDQLWLFVPFPG